MVVGSTILVTTSYIAAIVSGVIPPDWINNQILWLGLAGCMAASVFTAAAAD